MVPLSDSELHLTVPCKRMVLWLQEHMADPAFRSLVDRVEALWDELGLPDG